MSYPPFYALDILEISTRGGTLKYTTWRSRRTFLDRNDDYYLLSLLIRLRFIASGSRTGRGFIIIGRALSRAAIYTLVHARAARTRSAARIRYLIFIKSKRRAAPPRRHARSPATRCAPRLIASPRVYNEAGRCRVRARARGWYK